MSRALRHTAIAALAVVVLAGLGACGKNESSAPATTIAPTTASTASTTTTSAPPATTDPDVLVIVSPYFLRDGFVGIGEQQLVPGPAVARGALEVLLNGPSAVDQGAGLGTAIARGVQVNSLDLDAGVATVDFNRAFETADTRPQVAQVVYTLTQFPTITKVKFLVDGQPNGATGVLPIGRAELESTTPPVLVETPTPGAALKSTFTFAGTANTFEANVPWRVEDPSGAVRATGFATATSGTGTRGTFNTQVAVTGHTGPAVFVSFVQDMESGAETSVVRVPITVG